MNKSTLIVFLLACAVGAGAYAAYDRYYSGKRLNPFTDDGASQKSGAKSSAIWSTPVPANSAPPSSKVYKCFIDGKMVYTNEACPAGAKRREVKLHDSSGFLAPTVNKPETPAAKPAEPATKPGVTEVTPERKQARQPMQPTPPATGEECNALKQRIEALDKAARESLSGQGQDWIRRERSKVRDRQFALQC